MKKLVICIFIVSVFFLSIILSYYWLINIDGDNWDAIIVDQLSIEEDLKRDDFILNCTSLLNSSNFTVKYYTGAEVNVGFYRELPSKGKKIILVRAHSALRGSENVDLFTSETYSDYQAFNVYQDLINNGHLSKGVFDVPPYNEYFAITHSFVSSVMEGEFTNSIIILMGCNGLSQPSFANALIEKGAKVVIGWTNRIDLTDTDSSILELLRLLLAKNPYTIYAAVEKINIQYHTFNSTMTFYPEDEETKSYIIPKK